jgi:ribonucleoside-triphosphate reductase
MMNNQYPQPSVRANVLTRRTYNRPKNDAGTIFETWTETIDRVIEHQRWLWERALGDSLTKEQKVELSELRELMIGRYVAPAGRTLWLGNTKIAKTREISMFNCCALNIRTVHDITSCVWLLLNGCGVGFKPISGSLSGFTKRIEVQIIPSTRAATDKGRQNNIESFDAATKTWTIKAGDSAEAWAKLIGKVLAGKFPAKKLVIDLTEIRGAGARLAGYGWLSNGTKSLAIALEAICAIMNRQAGKLLTKIDLLDCCNLIGTILSSRRSAEIALFDYGESEWEEFATAKTAKTLEKNWHRSQSNNSLLFKEQPSLKEIKSLFDLIISNGGSEPGICNLAVLKERAPYADLLNPCGEIPLPGSGGLCNLCELDLGKFKNDHLGTHKALRLIARANFRQTCVELRDGILPDVWHQNNQFLHLCGVGLSGIARRPDLQPYDYRQLRNTAIAGTYSMADDLNMERPANTTCIKPSGTIAKISDSTEGCHRPMAKYIFNNVIFSKHDPAITKLANANYTITDHPFDTTSVLVTLPVSYDDVTFTNVRGVEVNLESAVDQLERYRMLQNNYVEQNTSITVSYDPSEAKSIVKWLDKNWHAYLAVSFLFRNDPTKTAKDLGYAYLPQQACTKETYDEYVSRLLPVTLDNTGTLDTALEQECVGGSCPIR